MKRSKILLCFILVISIVSLPLKGLAITLEEERKYGRETFAEIARSAPIFYDPFTSLYIDSMRRKLESSANPPFPMVVTVIDSTEANAFATFGGYVYITTGLIGMADKEEELAGVMAHEFAHIEKRHISKRIEKQKYMNAAMLGTMLLTMLVGGAQSKGAVLTTGMASVQAMSLKYSREDEEEADKAGAEFAYKAGYGGLGTADFLKNLRSSGGDKVLPQYLLTHPYHEERIIRIEATWAGKGPTSQDPFFPYAATRTLIQQKVVKPGGQDFMINRYFKNPNDPVAAYGAALVYMSKGETDKALSLVRAMDSPYRRELLGEMLVSARRYDDAVTLLQGDASPVGQFMLARAYEGQGKGEEAIDVLTNLTPYAAAYPEIYRRIGLLSGRMGREAKGFEYLGRYYVEIGRYDVAKTNLEKAVSKYGINARESQELLAILDRIKT
jgi:beta-barrel assembly-enhancing protease